jgi:hypothetical protein
MSFIAKLHLEEEELNVMHCGFRFSRNTDATGKPTSSTQGGSISLVIESTGSTNFLGWIISNSEKKSGDITFYRRDTMSKLKILKFKDAFCVGYYETFDHIGENPMQIQLTLSAREIDLDAVSFTNNWPS